MLGEIKVHDFLLEIGCEELPPNSLLPLSEALRENLKTELAAAGIGSYLNNDDDNQTMRIFAAPRRLAIIVKNLPEKTPTAARQELGPPVTVAYDAEGNPTQAAKGFAERQNIPVEALQIVMTEKGERIFANRMIPSQATTALLPSIVEKAVAKLPIIKPMRWGSHSVKFVRPVHWIVMIYERKLIQAKLLGCQTAQTTQGHRVHHPDPILLEIPIAYADKLRQAFVIASFEERKKELCKQLDTQAAILKASPVVSEDLLNEITGLVEWPNVLIASFNERFLNLPEEVLITSMQQHQKSVALKRDGKLIPYFLFAANIRNGKDEGNAVITGNERVMKARLSDAEFFYHQDKKKPLETWLEMTKNVIFQAKLGTLYDKSKRLIQLATYLALFLAVNTEEAIRSATLSQCDLMTDMVGEFPELQGLMGYYYALYHGESENIARALNEQYHPRFSGDKLPETPLGTLLSIADKIDTLIGAFSIHQKPTGSKDPFKLRRHALGLVRILIHHPYPLDLLPLLEFSFKNHPNNTINPNTVSEVHTFILERLEAYYTDEKAYSIPMVKAVLARQSTDLNDFNCRIQAVQEFSNWPEAPALAAANKRVSRILENETFYEKFSLLQAEEPAEKNLIQALNHQKEYVKPLLDAKQYTQALKALASLQEPIDDFFDTVMVNVENSVLRQNRLAILATLRQLFLKIADLSCLT